MDSGFREMSIHTVILMESHVLQTVERLIQVLSLVVIRNDPAPGIRLLSQRSTLKKA